MFTFTLRPSVRLLDREVWYYCGETQQLQEAR